MTVSEIWGNTHFKLFAKDTARRDYFLRGIAGYVGVIFFLIQSLGASDLLWVTAMWEGMITVGGAAAAVLILGEKFDHWIQWLGLSLGIVSMMMIHIGGHI